MKTILSNALQSINYKAGFIGTTGFAALSVIPVVDVLDLALKVIVAAGTLVATFKGKKAVRRRKKPVTNAQP